MTRKADKSNVFVILDKVYYENEIGNLLSDNTKFVRINRDPTNDLKRELNKHISTINNTSKSIRIRKCEGKYQPGYIYGNPKIHKRLENPPLRPIISQIGTVTYEVSKQLNSIITKYLPRRYTVKSSYEFATLLKGKTPRGILTSLDVESLFTNVPVKETIKIILENVYHHPELPPPDLPPTVLETLLLICTTKTPFKNINGDLYVQCEGVSMGSALGPTFADYYMCHLENKVFDDQPHLKPDIYVRYVDDCFLVVDNIDMLERIKREFERESVLQFTFEKEKKNQLSFLDSLITRQNDKYKTSVYVKSTNHGDCLNYRSICPDRYKTGVIKTLLHRGYAVCSDWQSFHQEIVRIKKLLTNNNYPMKVIDDTIRTFLNNKNTLEEATTRKNKIKIYYEGQMSNNYKIEEKQLKNIVANFVKPIKENDAVELCIYYKNKKIKDLFIHNKGKDAIEDSSRHHVVYKYKCNKEGCNSSINEKMYIGYTTCALEERFRMHTQTGSIKEHLATAHNIRRIPKADLLESTTILRTCHNRRKLIMTEAILIKELKPCLNSQDEGCNRLLKIFKH